MQTKSHTLRTIYKHYQETAEEKIEFEIFSDICSEFNIAIFESLLDGLEFNMQNNLGTLSVRKVERDPRSMSIDWLETNKYKKELQDEGVELFDSATG